MNWWVGMRAAQQQLHVAFGTDGPLHSYNGKLKYALPQKSQRGSCPSDGTNLQHTWVDDLKKRTSQTRSSWRSPQNPGDCSGADLTESNAAQVDEHKEQHCPLSLLQAYLAQLQHRTVQEVSPASSNEAVEAQGPPPMTKPCRQTLQYTCRKCGQPKRTDTGRTHITDVLDCAAVSGKWGGGRKWQGEQEQRD